MALFLRLGLLALLALGVLLPEWLPSFTAESSGQIRRIVSLSPGETQNLAYLGLIDRVVAVSPFDLHPDTQKLPRLPGINSSEEEILRHNPQMILVSESKDFDRLSSKGIKVYVSKTGGLAAVYSNLLQLEAFFGLKTSRAEEFRQRWQAMEGKAPRRGRYLLAIGVDPIYAVSTNTFLSEIMALAGWENAVETENPYPVLNEEDLSRLRADTIFMPLALVGEALALEKTRRMTGAARIVVLSNDNLMQPSPFLLDEVPLLKKL